MVRQQQWGVDSVQGYIEKMKSLHPVVQSKFGQVEQLLPRSNAEAECSFSSLRRVNTFISETQWVRGVLTMLPFFIELRDMINIMTEIARVCRQT